MNTQQANEVVVTPVTAADVDAIAALAREIWLLHYPGIITIEQIEYMLDERYRRERLLAELQMPDRWWDQARVDGVRVGFAACQPGAVAGAMKLDKIYVHPRLQRRGVGAALLESAVVRAGALGCSQLVLAVNKGNAGAIAAYRRYGFVLQDSVCADIGGGFVMDDYIMAKTL
jgi:ribosomal protein S18 acetylase RimI-like enzyme